MMRRKAFPCFCLPGTGSPHLRNASPTEQRTVTHNGKMSITEEENHQVDGCYLDSHDQEDLQL